MIIYLIQYYSTANNRLSRFNRCQRNPTNAMEIHILTCKQKVANFGRNGHLGLKHVFTITPMTVQTAFLYHNNREWSVERKQRKHQWHP